MRFWKVTSRILRGVKRVGGFEIRAVPAGRDSGGLRGVSDYFVEKLSSVAMLAR
jgi:hypothetical protein